MYILIAVVEMSFSYTKCTEMYLNTTTLCWPFLNIVFSVTFDFEMNPHLFHEIKQVCNVLSRGYEAKLLHQILNIYISINKSFFNDYPKLHNPGIL